MQRLSDDYVCLTLYGDCVCFMLYCVHAETADKGGEEKGARSWALALAALLAQTAEC
jgi:hypothetical protein